MHRIAYAAAKAGQVGRVYRYSTLGEKGSLLVPHAAVKGKTMNEHNFGISFQILAPLSIRRTRDPEI